MKKRKPWFYILCFMILLFCAIWMFLTNWIFNVIKERTDNVEEEQYIDVLRYVLPQLTYYDQEINLDELTEEQLLLLGLKVTYHLPYVDKTSTLEENQEKILLQGEDLRNTMKDYFGIQYDSSNHALPPAVRYLKGTDIYEITVTDSFGNSNFNFVYEIQEVKQSGNQLSITIRAKNINSNTYLITLHCPNNHCYFQSSKEL